VTIPGTNVSVRTSSTGLGIKTYSTELGRGHLCVDVAYHTLYVDAETRPGASTLRLHVYLEIGRNKPRDPNALFPDAGIEKTYDTEGYFDIAGKAKEMIIEVKTEGVLKNGPGRTSLYPQKTGESDVLIQVADAKIVVPVTVAKLPVKIGDSSKEVIEKLGLPDFKRFAGAAFPHSKTIHNIFYNWDTHSAYHWGYKEFPGAVIVIQSGKVKNISSTFIKGSWSRP